MQGRVPHLPLEAGAEGSSEKSVTKQKADFVRMKFFLTSAAQIKKKHT